MSPCELGERRESDVCDAHGPWPDTECQRATARFCRQPQQRVSGLSWGDRLLRRRDERVFRVRRAARSGRVEEPDLPLALVCGACWRVPLSAERRLWGTRRRGRLQFPQHWLPPVAFAQTLSAERELLVLRCPCCAFAGKSARP